MDWVKCELDPNKNDLLVTGRIPHNQVIVLRRLTFACLNLYFQSFSHGFSQKWPLWTARFSSTLSKTGLRNCRIAEPELF
jgi:hypothetical protein